METSALVSVITPLYNSEKYISETIESVQNQTHENWEMIIVNDASTDKSIEIAQKYAAVDSRIVIENLPENKGAAFCRNRATNIAKGDYIAFLDSDDKWHEEKLQRQLDFMKSNDCDVSLTNYLHIDGNGVEVGRRIIALSKLSARKQQKNNYIGNLTGMYNAQNLGKILSPNIRKRQDWAVWLEAIEKSGKPALGLREDLALYRVTKESMSANKWKLLSHNFQFYRKHLKYSPLKSLGWMIQFLWEYFTQRPKLIQKY